MKTFYTIIALLLLAGSYCLGSYVQYRQDRRQVIKLVDALAHSLQTVYAKNQGVAR